MDLVRLLVVLVRFVGPRLKRWFERRGSESWPAAEGRVFQAKVKRGELAGWICELTYSYQAAGEYYSGTYERGFALERRAEQFVERFPSGTHLRVRYKPGREAVSTVLAEDMNLHLIGF